MFTLDSKSILRLRNLWERNEHQYHPRLKIEMRPTWPLAGVYLVQSGSEPTRFYRVICGKAAGEPRVICDCPAGHKNTPCRHAAVAAWFHSGLVKAIKMEQPAPVKYCGCGAEIKEPGAPKCADCLEKDRKDLFGE
jgi:hypothetical protein